MAIFVNKIFLIVAVVLLISVFACEKDDDERNDEDVEIQEPCENFSEKAMICDSVMATTKENCEELLEENNAIMECILNCDVDFFCEKYNQCAYDCAYD